MKEQQITIKDFVYDLPLDKIAKYPLEERDASKLLVYRNGECSDSHYLNIDQFISADSMLFFNNTKVIPARLFFKTINEKIIEVFCLEPEESKDIFHEMTKQKEVLWRCIVGNLNKWKEEEICLEAKGICITANIIERRTDHLVIQFKWTPAETTFSEILQIAGAVPIPPYLKRSSEAIDILRYQTLYAKTEGSVAAPTAGLHFTERVFEKLMSKGISLNYLTLHVGAGTFKPVKSKTMADHEMHREYIELKIETIENLLINLDKNIVSVGTTSMRTLESIYWLGLKTFLDDKIELDQLVIHQWDPYELRNQQIPAKQAIESLIKYLKFKDFDSLYSETSLLILPGYEFKLVNALVTNFHQPESTLILLVASFIGEDWRKVYKHALNHEYRFLSYGDGSLLFKA